MHRAVQEYVEISVGSDDGVFKNHQNDRLSRSRYLATIRITDVYPDKAIGLVIEDTRNGTIARGDNVTTKY